jgi:hypothetical protein
MVEEGRSPLDLRYTFVSLMSGDEVPVEEIARLAGRNSTATKELACHLHAVSGHHDRRRSGRPNTERRPMQACQMRPCPCRGSQA